MDRPSVDGPSVDMFGVVAPPIDMFDTVDNEILMLKMDERGQREEKLDGILLTDYMFH